MTALQMAEWTAYESLEPFGQRHVDYGLGLLGSIIARVFTGKSISPDNCRPQTRLDKKVKKKQSPGQIKAFFRQLKEKLKKQGN